MVEADAITVLRILKANYPQTYRGISKEDAQDIISLWTTMFENDSVQIVTEAVKALIHTNKFPPTIADVKDKIRLMTEEPAMTELEAWSIVSKAIRDSYYNSLKVFEELPEQIRSVIRKPEQLREWGQMDSEVVNSVVASNFMRSYKAYMQHENTIRALPESTKELISNLKGKMLLEG